MSCLILPRRFYSQPSGAVEIDWNNPITQGLIHTFTGNSLRDDIFKREIVLAGTGALGSTEHGRALIGNNTNASGSLAIDLSPYRGFSFSGWVWIPASYGAYDMVYEYTPNLNSTTGGFYLLLNSGKFEQTIRTSSSYGSVNYVLPGSGWHYITTTINLDAASNTTQQYLYVNGQRETVLNYSYTALHSGAFPNSALYLMSRGNSSLQLDSRMPGLHLHGRELNADEAAALAANHWQIFKAK